MTVFLNGRLVPEEQAVVSVFDRGFLYGDGLYETLRICNGKPFRWTGHLERFARGAAFLKIQSPYTADQLLEQALELIRLNQTPEALLRILLSRGVGPRGFSPKGAASPALVMTLHPAPDTNGKAPPTWGAITASTRLPANESLSLFKNCNRLPQILAKAEADAAGADEALLLNTNGEIVEASASNLFWIRDNVVCTPSLTSGILAGVTRLVVFEICRKLGVPTRETAITPAELRSVQGVFLSLSSWGIVEVVSLDQHDLERSPLVKRIQTDYEAVLRSECG
jgi:aminodeoxychorismate lyase